MLVSLLSALLSLLIQLALRPLRYALGSKTKPLVSSESALTISSDDSDSVSVDGSCCHTRLHDDDDLDGSMILKEVSLQNRRRRSRIRTFTNFVAQSTGSRDALVICDLVQQRQSRLIHFQDTVPGSTYRRWHYKKTGVFRQVLKVANDHKVPITFETTVEIDTATMSCNAIISLLRELEKDVDVKNITLRGSLDYKDTEDVLLALLSLLTNKDRRGWQTIVFDINVTAPSDHPHEQREAQIIHRVCQRALQKVAYEHYITVHTR